MRTTKLIPAVFACALTACGAASPSRPTDAGTDAAVDAELIDGCIPTTEICNGIDDDCDGVVDNGFQHNGVYDTDMACGGCSNNCVALYGSLPNATGTCNTTGAPTCELACNPGFFDFDGDLADGCELEVDLTGIYVSTVDTMAADDATCGIGPAGTGSGNHPCKSIAQGLARATSAGAARVLVANGLYDEPVTLQNGIDLLGGYDPMTWQRDVVATTTTIAGVSSAGNHDRTVIASNITSATKLEGFVIYGSANEKPGGNSYAIYASGSGTTLSIVNNIVFGGVGGPGVEGSIGGNGSNGVGGSGRNPNLAVADASYDAEAATGTGECATTNNRQHANGGVQTCGADTVSGGEGGGNQCPVMSYCDTYDPNYGCLTATTNFHWSNYTPLAGATGMSGGGALGGTAGVGAAPGTDMIQIYASFYGGYICYIPPSQTFGLDGNNGGDGAHAAGVAGCTASSGSIVGGDWVGGAAPAGTSGGNGGGGGGGGAGGGGKCESDGHGHTTCTDGTGKDTLGGHGGGGGSGGCGGAGGGAAGPGGGAFDIFIVGTAAPVVQGNQLLRGTGGGGGPGGAAGSGGTGGLGAGGGTTGVPVVFCTDVAGRGGDGGNGGDGAGGGGGCGGSSFGVYTSGIGTPNYCTHDVNMISGGGGGGGGPGGYSIINPGGDGSAGQLVDCSFN